MECKQPDLQVITLDLVKRAKMQAQIVRELEELVGKSNVYTEKAQMLNYLLDETPIPIRPQPADDLVLVKPSSSHQVAAVLRLAN
jgi:hypothetical protein